MKRRNLLKSAILLPAALRPAQLLPQGRVYRPDFEPRNVEIAAVEYLKPGQFVTIRAIRPPTRSERKAARRAKG